MAKHMKIEPKSGNRKVSLIVYICISVVYFLVVVGATVYSLTAYQQNLPLVELTRVERGRVPKDCLYETGSSLVFCTVEQQDGPWGKRYVIKQTTAYNYQEIDDETMFVYDAVSNENPIVRGVSGAFLYDGMEVRIS